MHCPKCHHANFDPGEPCPSCQFQGDPSSIEELTHIDWMLKEVSAWHMLGLSSHQRRRLQGAYETRQRKLQVTLGLRLPPFTPNEARQAWPEFFQRQALLQKMAEWQQADRLKPDSIQTMLNEARRQVDELQEQLEGHLQPTYPQNDAERLDVVNFLLEAVDYLSQNQYFATPNAETLIRSPLLVDKEMLELNLGLRPEPKPEPKPVAVEIAQTIPKPTEVVGTGLKAQAAAPAAQVVVSPALPFGERVWRTLLSERTLQALLFLGIFLFFIAAILFVVRGWESFSAPIRVAIPTFFTIVFFGFGWYVRTQTPLYRSGIALSAIAALLIPIDFYTIYINFNIPQNYWAFFWFVTSIFCVAAYTAAALIIRSRLYGYLVGLAAGSTALAFIEMVDQTPGPSDWSTAGLASVALGLLGVTIILESSQAKKFTYFTESFRFLALMGISIILVFTFGWRYIDRGDTYDTLHYALSIDWWIGAVIFGWGAVFYRQRGLGVLAAVALPMAMFLTQAALFDQVSIEPAWHAFGFALLVPIYLLVGYALAGEQADPVIQSFSKTAIRIGLLLLIVTMNWSLISGNGWVTANSHLVLALSIVLAALLWQRPIYLYAASFFSLTALSAAIVAWRGDWSLLSVAWTSLAILHLIIAWQVGSRFPSPLPSYARSLVVAGYIVAALALMPVLVPYNGDILVYALANWTGLSVWGAYLAHKQQPGFTGKTTFGKTTFHWFTVVALPIWIWLFLFNANVPDFIVPLVLVIVAWSMVILSYRLKRVDPLYRTPWWLAGMLVSVIAPLVAFTVAPAGITPAITLLAAGLLYFTDAIVRRQSTELLPAGLVTAAGYLLLLDRYLATGPLYVALAGLLAIYVFGGLWVERKRSTTYTHSFLAPLYITSHFLSLLLLLQIYVFPLINFLVNSFSSYSNTWTDELKLWGAAAQLILGLVYAGYAWGTYKERWGHVAAWLIAAGGGLAALTLSTGRGSSAAKAALLAIVFILAERGLYWLRQRPGINRQQAYIRLTWHLYRRPLLVTGWAISAVAIILALLRNLLILEGGRTQQIWAAIALLLVTGLYALSARLFRQARFMWLASVLIFAPWTILSNLGWFSGYYPTLPGFAVSWLILAWSLLLTGLLLNRFAPPAYSRPLKVVAHLLIPWSLLWGIVNVDTSRVTFGLAIAFYALAATLAHREYEFGEGKTSVWGTTGFLYPALGLVPIWSVYLLAWLLPPAPHELYGILILGFAVLGLFAGQWLYRIAPQREMGRYYALPGYVTAYTCMVAGTLLVVHVPTLLTLALLYNALLLLVSAWLFKQTVWVYLAGVVTPLALWAGLSVSNVAGARYGWWLIGLASIYLVLAWILRQGKLKAFGTPPLVIALALVAISLVPSSIDQTGALWGYTGAVLLYAIVAFWLGQPLLLLPASILAIVPYSILIQRSAIALNTYGLALLPGAVAALGLGWWLDHKFGCRRDFPWKEPWQWLPAIADRSLGWWGFAPFLVGFGLALVSPLFDNGAGVLALNFLLLVPIFGWAIYYFRLRIWLLALGIAGHLAAVFYLADLNLWQYPAQAWVRFLPITLMTVGFALFIEYYGKEGSPLTKDRMFQGWSRPLYLLAIVDITFGQLMSLQASWSGLFITVTNVVLIAIVASFWLSSVTSYVSLILGVAALVQGLMIMDGPIEGLPVALAGLALGYGLIGYGLTILRRQVANDWTIPRWLTIWELPFQSFSLGFSLGVLVLTLVLGIDTLLWTLRAVFDIRLRDTVELISVQMIIGVSALLGVLYLGDALVYRRLRLGYVAIGMLLTSWLLQAFYIQQWTNTQWFVIPIGLYLLGIGYCEWQQGNKTLGRWCDYLAILVMMGTLFGQTLNFGLGYALLLGVEGFLFMWWGTARRLRRFLYAGTGGVVLAAVGELANQFSSINQWVVFGIVGLLVIITAIVVERKLDDIRAWQELETWE